MHKRMADFLFRSLCLDATLVIDFPLSSSSVRDRNEPSIHLTGVTVEHIDQYLRELTMFGVRQKANTKELERLYSRDAYAEMLGELKHLLYLDCRIVLGKVRDGGPKDAPAWVSIPYFVPSWGTPHFRATTFTVFMRKEYLRESGFAATVVAMAHEYAHIILAATNHPKKHDEKAVDLTAMILGFAELYQAGRVVTRMHPPRTASRWPFSLLDRFFTDTAWQTQIGYLSEEEMDYAVRAIQHLRR
jgi:hypothetical protein